MFPSAVAGKRAQLNVGKDWLQFLKAGVEVVALGLRTCSWRTTESQWSSREQV
jgi:hypothetical protein